MFFNHLSWNKATILTHICLSSLKSPWSFKRVPQGSPLAVWYQYEDHFRQAITESVQHLAHRKKKQERKQYIRWWRKCVTGIKYVTRKQKSSVLKTVIATYLMTKKKKKRKICTTKWKVGLNWFHIIQELQWEEEALWSQCKTCNLIT